MVEWKKLGDLGSYFGGLTGKTKEDFVDGNAKFITYMNVFSNPSLNTTSTGTVRIGVNEKQNKLQKGDILFTGSSETPEEAGMSCVVTKDLEGDYYMNSFCFGIRVDYPEKYNLHYLKYILRSNAVRKEAAKSASGVTRFNISKSRFGKILIPIPSLEEQERIVGILDTFTASIDNIKAQIEQRRKQYEHYRNTLLTFNKDDESVEWKTLGEIGEIIRGNGLQKTDFVEEGVGCVHYGQIYTRLGFSLDKTLTFVPKELAEKLTTVEPGNLIIACTSENIEDVCKSVVWLGNENIVTGGHACVFKHHENPKYIGYCFLTHDFFNQKKKYAYGAKVIDIKTEKLSLIQIPLPSLARQQEIVSILDTFEASIANLEAQLEQRQKQYEYYREELLTNLS